jgi:hypothetical protein
MSDIAALIADMVRAGVDPDIIGRTAAALSKNVQVVQSVQDPVADRRRAYDRDRKAAKKLSTGIPPESTESADRVSPKKETSPTPPKEKTTPSTVSEARASSTETRAGFSDFWAMFPNKVGKRDAEKAFATAVKRAGLDDILAGVERYAAKTDDRPWCNPATFLNQDRWGDQPAAVARLGKPTTAPPQRTVSDVLGDIKSGRLEVPSILDLIKGKTDEPPEHSGPTIDAGFERSDFGSPGRSNQLYAFPSGRRS